MEGISHKAMSLRSRSAQKRIQTDLTMKNLSFKPGKGRASRMTKTRRKTANQKERERMKVVNEAFDRLRGVMPDIKTLSKEEKDTKVTTLRAAITYICGLQDLIQDLDSGIVNPSIFHDVKDEDNNSIPNYSKTKIPNMKKGKSKTISYNEDWNKIPTNVGPCKIKKKNMVKLSLKENGTTNNAAIRNRNKLIKEYKNGFILTKENRQIQSFCKSVENDKIENKPLVSHDDLNGKKSNIPNLRSLQPLSLKALYPNMVIHSSDSLLSKTDDWSEKDVNQTVLKIDIMQTDINNHDSQMQIHDASLKGITDSKDNDKTIIKIYESESDEDSLSDSTKESKCLLIAPESPTNIFPNAEDLFQRSFSFEIDNLSKTNSADENILIFNDHFHLVSDDHLIILEDIQNIIKEKSEFELLYS